VLANQRLLDQVRALEQVCEPGMDGLSTLRRHRELFEQRFRASDANGGHGSASARPDGAETTTDSAFATDRRRTTVRRDRATHAAQTTRTPDRSVDEPSPAAIVLEPGEELTVVHVEHHAPLRDVVRAVVQQCGCARYAALQDIAPGSEGSQHLLAVNMLAHEIDPLSTICDPRWRQREARAFMYLSAGSRGIVAGLVDFILYPLDPNDCATRLLERTGGIQRLLMVSDKIDAMNEIRTVLNRLECSTSLALDDRQGLNLVGMVKPDAILIDLTLPRAGGVRLITQIRSNPSMAGIAIFLALGEPFDAGRFQTEAGRVLGECRFSDDELSAALGQVLSQVQIADATAVPATT
jgi:CheY-like chemotaxis protein